MVTAWPARTDASARALPTLPAPMMPIFMAFPHGDVVALGAEVVP
jgi:hypothetical protein